MFKKVQDGSERVKGSIRLKKIPDGSRGIQKISEDSRSFEEGSRIKVARIF